jgi:hypothetical protein
MPFFLDVAPSPQDARSEILETLASYGARTRQECLHAAHIIAFGLSALDALAQAKAEDMSPSLRLRHRSCANGLNRACQQNEKALAKPRACQDPAATPDDLPEPDLQQALLQARARITATRNRLSNTAASAPSGKGSAIFDALWAQQLRTATA